MRSRVFAGAAALTVCLASAADAATPLIFPASYLAIMQSHDVDMGFAAPGSYAAGTMAISIGGLPFAAISTTNHGPGFGATSVVDGTITYSAGIFGQDNGLIPLRLLEYMHVEVHNSASGVAAMSVSDHAGTLSYRELDGFAYSNDDKTFSDYVHFSAHPGDSLIIRLYTGVGAHRDGSVIGYGFSYIDPYLEIDPSYSLIDPNYKNDYQLIFSPAVGNGVPGAPEPSLWSLMISGFGLTGLTLRRRHVAIAA